MSSKKVWVGVLNYDETKYIPSEYYEDDIYKGKDALPYFNTLQNCKDWCDAKNGNTEFLNATLNIQLNREEVQHLLNALTSPSLTQEAIKVQLEIEEILANFLKATE